MVSGGVRDQLLRVLCECPARFFGKAIAVGRFDAQPMVTRWWDGIARIGTRDRPKSPEKSMVVLLPRAEYLSQIAADPKMWPTS